MRPLHVALSAASIALAVFASGCKARDDDQRLAELQAKLDEQSAKLERLQQQVHPSDATVPAASTTVTNPARPSTADWKALIDDSQSVTVCAEALDPNVYDTINLAAPCASKALPKGEQRIDGLFASSFSVDKVQPVETGGVSYAIVSTHWESGASGGGDNVEILRFFPDGGPQPVARLGGPTLDHIDASAATIVTRAPMRLEFDANCCPSFYVKSHFRLSAQGLHLVARASEINPSGGLAQSREAPPQDVEEATRQISTILLDQSATPAQRAERIRQATLPQEILATGMRFLPIYDPETQTFRTFDSVARDMAAGGSGTTPLERDPVGTAVSLVFDPSVSNIASKMGLDMPF